MSKAMKESGRRPLALVSLLSSVKRTTWLEQSFVGTEAGLSVILFYRRARRIGGEERAAGVGQGTQEDNEMKFERVVPCNEACRAGPDFFCSETCRSGCIMYSEEIRFR